MLSNGCKFSLFFLFSLFSLFLFFLSYLSLLGGGGSRTMHIWEWMIVLSVLF